MKRRTTRKLALEALETRHLMATLTASQVVAGQTPITLGYNLGHFMDGSNAADWWRYEGVMAARAFVSPSDIEPTDDIAGTGDGVTDQTSFMARRQALRTNAASPTQPLDNSYINWPKFQERYQNSIGDTNRFTINYAFGQLRSQNAEILVNMTASPSRFPIASDSDWANKWELWQHYYAQSFYLGSNFDVERFSMFNEPNNWTGLTVDNWLIRLNVASDAIKSAISDVNARYGKSLVAEVFAPNTANGSTKYLEWGQPAVLQRHKRIDGTIDPAWSTFDVYNYQKYSMNQHETTTASGYIEDLQALRTSLTTDTPGETPPIALTEYNVRTGDNYDTRTETLDSPTDYAALGANSIALTENNASQLYLFKFAQTQRTGTTNYPVAKNGTHYVQNGTVSNHYGGATKGAEVYRLFNKAAGSGRNRYAFSSDAGGNVWNLFTYDPARDTYYAFVVNNNSTSVPMAINVAAWGIANGTHVVVEEVSGSYSGGVARNVRITNGSVPSATMPAYSAWLVSIPRQATSEIIVNATADAVLGDGVQKGINGGNAKTLEIRDGGVVDGRRVTLVKFPLDGLNSASMQRVLLSLQVGTISQATPIQSHVYGVTNDVWSETGVTWANMTSALKQNVAAGTLIANNVVASQGAETRMLGQLVAQSTTLTEGQIDVSDFVRSQTDGWASFMIVQDHRWDVALPGLTAGDAQSDGLKIAARESGTAAIPGPRLKVLGSQTAMIPLITSQPTSLSVTEGGSATFTVAATGSSALSYQWRRNGTAITGATGPSYTLSSTTIADNQSSYSVTVTNSAGTVTSTAAVLTVQSIATKFFVVDQSADRTFRYQANGSFVNSSPLQTGNTVSRGIATDATGSTFWVIDSNKTVYVYNASLQFVGSWVASGLTTPTGISKTGNDIWIVDSGSRKVFVYAGAALTNTGPKSATRSFALNSSNNNPQDLVTDGTTVWVTQSATTDKVFVYQASNGASLGNWTIDSANGSPYGITIDPTVSTGDIWIVDNVADRIFEYTGARSRTSGSQAAAKSYALNSANSSPQGIADPPPMRNLSTSAFKVAATDSEIPMSLISAGELVDRGAESRQRVTTSFAKAVDQMFTAWQPERPVDSWATLTPGETKSTRFENRNATKGTAPIAEWLTTRESLFSVFDDWIAKSGRGK